MSDSTEAQRYVWEGSIPLQIHLHESEITTLPSPPPALILGPRIGYLPLLAPLIKPYFSSTLPPGVDTVWFEYKGLPLKWYIPTGVLFDLLSLEPERPWNLTVHFRGYPLDLLSPCEGEESVKWSFINSLKEAAYIINGNCKNVMNMSQPDQLELWRSFINVNMDGNLRIASKLKLTTIGEEHWTKATSSSTQARQSNTETDNSGQSQTGRVPVRLYVRNVDEDIDDLDASPVDSWDRISYMNRPVEIHKEGEDPIKKLYLGVDEHADGFLSKVFTLHDAIKSLLPEFFEDEPSVDEAMSKVQLEDMMENPETRCSNPDSDNAGTMVEEAKEKSEKPDLDSCCPPRESAIKLVRIQGITPKLEIPFTWVVKSLMNPEHFLHICVFVGVKQDQGMIR